MKPCPYCGHRPGREEKRCSGCGADRSFDPTVRGVQVLAAMVVGFVWVGACLYFGGYRAEPWTALGLGVGVPVGAIAGWFVCRRRKS